VSTSRHQNHGLVAFCFRYLATLVATAIAIVILWLTLVRHFDIIRWNVELLQHIEGTSVDDVIFCVLLVIVCLIVDSARFSSRQRGLRATEEERMRVFKSTMLTVQDLVNNALTNLQMVRLEADTLLPSSTLALFDGIIHDTAGQLKLLGDLEVLIEQPMVIGVGIKYGDPSANG
jgi:hypothetical protein